MDFGLYLHIPFCRQKCFYCDFPSYEGLEPLHERYAAALRREILQKGDFLRRRQAGVDTVYIGGGTPTSLPISLLFAIVAAVKESFLLRADTEFTVEANPGTVDFAALSLLRAGGVNRVSFGVQCFQDAILRRIGRVHSAEDARAAVAAARKAGFENISVDLMYGLPSQRLNDLEESVGEAAALGAAHISVYGLQVEEGTPFAARQAAGTLKLPDDEETERMYEYIARQLPLLGYERYEISNFARGGFASRHNLKYWQNRPYLGLGAAAHSYIEPERFAHSAVVRDYIDAVTAGQNPEFVTERLDRDALMEEFCFLALRTREGISRRAFEEKFSCKISEVYAHTISSMTAKGLLRDRGGAVALTERGMKFGNQVFCAFLLK